MTSKKFDLFNNITATLALVLSAVVYCLTIEPSASFWDCGEFIASSYKLEVGHPPGNPVFQIVARFFTLFGDNPAVAVNICSALCSAFTIFFLYLTTVFFAKRLVKADEEGNYTVPQAVAIYAAGLVGALVYTFTDTFWFSAVEAEVYAMSSLFTAIVMWAMTRWADTYTDPHSSRWIVFISLMMGLSIGVHLLNLLTIPALVFLYFYTVQQDKKYTFKQIIGIFALSCVIIAVILFGIVPFVPALAAFFDRMFVNGLGLPYNSGAIFFIVALLALCFALIVWTQKNQKVLANIVAVCFTVIVIGFSVFSIVIIRSVAKTPTNEYQPDNPYTLIRYLSREQYGSTPLIYGEYFDADYDLEDTYYWAPLDGKYVKTKGQPKVIYAAKDKMFFPRMWSSDARHKEVYQAYMAGNYRKPTMADNLIFFFDYQMHWMYWRYFMWNFVGRQNDIYSPQPGEQIIGNWESGIKFIDNLHLIDTDDAPAYISQNKGRNHYYFLPLILGLIGLLYQVRKDSRGAWITFLLFFMTGIAIVLYLNQPPLQVRERDYAYAGSFYAFSIWIGLGVVAIWSWINEKLSGKAGLTTALCTAALTLAVPVEMAAQNWDDHDRSNRATAVELAANYLNSVGPQGILITHGDNDTFPVWYAQEVEGIRPDVRICNTSLLGTDWHIDQMKYACNDSKPLDLKVGMKQYLYGQNEYIPIYEIGDENAVYPLEAVMELFRDPKRKVRTSAGSINVIAARKFSIPVNKENALKAGIVPEKFANDIPAEIVLTIPESKRYLTKPELFLLDLLSNYDWSRPINLLNMGGDLNVGIKEYLMYDGFSYRFVPFKTGASLAKVGKCDVDDLYYKVMNVFKWDAISRTDYYVDYQNKYTFAGVVPQRRLFTFVASKLIDEGRNDEAVQVLRKGVLSIPQEVIPYDISYLHLNNERDVCLMIDTFRSAGADEDAIDLCKKALDEILVSVAFYSKNYDYCYEELKDICDIASYEIGILDRCGATQASQDYEDRLYAIIEANIPEEYRSK